ncbi:ATP-grasp domain-containing protein [Candidatus Cytomitobacter primus]|uniref:ATP-grasp domain-containing protein n=1 Tax=Candidatus Cytomitobacter primus TaxID=2066024 RepID=A0A5C0UH89_9PROT|nr:ATP-grasp domain-containing protein [Candidatus Cytomitobacter primus]QEK38682.1 ATP-grasp domain-containing protein [Candidatus Cytomitobacter primus]
MSQNALNMKNIVLLAGGWTEVYPSLKSAKKVESILTSSNILTNFDFQSHGSDSLQLPNLNTLPQDSGVTIDSNQNIIDKIIHLDPANGLNELRDDILRIQPDIIVNLVHGYWGEDGYAQRFLDELKFPYTGPRFNDASISINKHIMRSICTKLNIPISSGGFYSEKKYREKAHCYPHIVKPLFGGSSYGVHVINSDEEKDQYKMSDQAIICEEFIEGPELCVVVKNGKCYGSMIIECEEQFYTIHAKNTDKKVKFLGSESYVDQGMVKAAQEYAVGLYNYLDGHGIARIDFKLSDKAYFIDYNSIPGMTLLPRILKFNNYSDSDFAKLLLE